jgi:hypothetical protein
MALQGPLFTYSDSFSQESPVNKAFSLPFISGFHASLWKCRAASKSRHPFLPRGLLVGGKFVESLDVGDLAIRMKREFDGFVAFAGFLRIVRHLRGVCRRGRSRRKGGRRGGIWLDDARAQPRQGPARINTQIFHLDMQKNIYIDLATGRRHGRGDCALRSRVGCRVIANLVAQSLADVQFGKQDDAFGLIARFARNRHQHQAAAEESQ